MEYADYLEEVFDLLNCVDELFRPIEPVYSRKQYLKARWLRERGMTYEQWKVLAP
jgi:hypothetical protein